MVYTYGRAESGSLRSMRILSLIIASAYVIVTFLSSWFAPPRSLKASIGGVLLVCAFLILPLVCIWFGEEIGDYTGLLPGPGINKRTPGSLVKFGGWVLLLLPLVVFWLARP